jgi:tetratricopeptide (TPR) repeat protein
MLNSYEEGLEWSKRALKKDASTQDRLLKARCNLFLGIGSLLMVKTLETHAERQQQIRLAEEYLLEAQKADMMDHLCEFYLAFHYAHVRKIKEALVHIHRALDLHPEHLPSYHLMILLLSAKGEYEEALEMTELTLEEFPDSIPILSLKVRLSEKVHGYEEAIFTAKRKSIIKIFRRSFDNRLPVEMLKRWQVICESLPRPDEVDTVSQHNARPTSTSVGGYGTIGGNSYDQINGYTVPRNPAFDALSDKVC